MSNARNTILADLFLRGLPYLLIALMLFFLGIVTGVIAAEQLSANQTHEMLTYIHDFISHIDSCLLYTSRCV